MKQLNKTIVIGVIALLIIILIIIMTFMYVNNLREEQIGKLKDKEDEISLVDQIKNLTYLLDLYRGDDLIYGEGVIKNSSSTSNGYFLLSFNNTEYHPKNLPDNYKKDNITISFIAFTNQSYDPISGKQYINFLRIEDTDLDFPNK